MLIDGDMFVEQCSEERIAAPELVALAGRVEVRHSPHIDAMDAYAGRRAEVEVHMRDGRVLEQAADRRPGDPSNPLSTQQIIDKFARLAAAAVPSLGSTESWKWWANWTASEMSPYWRESLQDPGV